MLSAPHGSLESGCCRCVDSGEKPYRRIRQRRFLS
jgi:hypothetical protein